MNTGRSQQRPVSRQQGKGLCTVLSILLTVLCSPFPAVAAWNFAAAKVKATSTAVLDLPNGDYSVCLWVKLDSNSGTGVNTMWGRGAVSAAPSANVYFRGASAATAPNEISVNIRDASNNVHFFNSATAAATGTSRDWQSICTIRSGSTVTLYRDGDSIGSAVNATVQGSAPGTDLVLGDSGTETTHALEGSLAEWAKWDRALSDAERTTLLRYAPSCVPGAQVYIPMIRELQELRVPLALTNTNATVAAHPPLLHCW